MCNLNSQVSDLCLNHLASSFPTVSGPSTGKAGQGFGDGEENGAGHTDREEGWVLEPGMVPVDTGHSTPTFLATLKTQSSFLLAFPSRGGRAVPGPELAAWGPLQGETEV